MHFMLKSSLICMSKFALNHLKKSSTVFSFLPCNVNAHCVASAVHITLTELLL